MKKMDKIIFPLVLTAIFAVALILLYEIYLIGKNSSAEINNGVLFEATIDKDSDIASMGLFLSGNQDYQIARIAERYAIKITLDKHNDTCSYRSEVVPTKLNRRYFNNNRAKVGTEYWYHLDIFLPEDWQYGIGKKTVMQWHDCPDTKLGEKWRNPPLALEIDNSTTGNGKCYVIRHRADSKKITQPSGPYEIDERIELGAIHDDLGKWTSWSFHVKWSYKDNGFLFVFKNGNLVLKRERQKNTYNDKRGPFWKFGVYIPFWKHEEIELPEGELTRYTAYFDHILIGNRDLKTINK